MPRHGMPHAQDRRCRAAGVWARPWLPPHLLQHLGGVLVALRQRGQQAGVLGLKRRGGGRRGGGPGGGGPQGAAPAGVQLGAARKAPGAKQGGSSVPTFSQTGLAVFLKSGMGEEWRLTRGRGARRRQERSPNLRILVRLAHALNLGHERVALALRGGREGGVGGGRGREGAHEEARGAGEADGGGLGLVGVGQHAEAWRAGAAAGRCASLGSPCCLRVQL
jgi:hypothetical protein